MSSRQRFWSASLIVAALSGCAESGSILAPRTSVGTLKTGLSHMEFENQQLRKRVSSLEAENRQVENDLVREQSANGDISARLDDALAMLKRRGLLGGDVAGSDPDNAAPEPPRTTLPAGRSNKKPRKPPFAQIPGQLDIGPSSTDDDNAFRGWGTGNDSTRVGPQSRVEDPTVWLPVARGTTQPSAPLR